MLMENSFELKLWIFLFLWLKKDNELSSSVFTCYWEGKLSFVNNNSRKLIDILGYLPKVFIFL